MKDDTKPKIVPVQFKAKERDITKDPIWDFIFAGRTFDEQVEYIQKEGLYGSPSTLRWFALRNLGLGKPKETAENVICFGCYPLFSRPKDLQSYFRLLDRLGIEYSYLDKEYCCGAPLIEPTKGLQKERGIKAARGYVGMNIAASRERGAKNMVYMCVWCVHIAKMLFPHEDIKQLYSLDILMDKLTKENLKVKPTIVGYYEGCHTRTHAYAPGIRINWLSYRQLLGSIKGLEVVDLPRKFCCSYDLGRIAEEIDKRDIHTVVCPCNSCALRLRALDKIEVRLPQDILLEALG